MTTLLVAGLALAGLAVPAGVPPAAAAGGITEESHVRYVVTKKGKVTATVTTTITNVTPDEGAYYYFWDSYVIGVPASAKGLRVTSNGGVLPVRTEDSEDPNAQWAVTEFSPLRYGRSRTIEWTYTIAGAKIRSDRWTRVGPGYATFAALAVGDEGRAGVEVVAPRSMRFDSPADFDRERDGKRYVYTLDEWADGAVWAPVSLRDPEMSDTSDVRVGDHVITVHSFPGDTRWSEFATEQIEEGIPVLEEIMGVEWPANVHDVRQDTSPNVLGYGGWFDGYDREIVVDESLDVSLLLHELTHAWINGGTTDDLWLTEGLTEVVAQRALERTGADADPREIPRRKSDVAFPLDEWDTMDEADEESVLYGYDAAYTAAQQLTRDLDDDAFAALMTDVHEGNSRYADPERAGQFRGFTDWRRFLDLLELHGGGESADATMERWVVDGKGEQDLFDRTEAREVYVALDEADGAWMPPQGVRSAMTFWSFGAAGQAVEALGDAPDLAAEVQRAAQDAGLPVPESIREAYEVARDEEAYQALAPTLTEAAAALGVVGEVSQAVAAESDPVTELGEVLLAAEDAAADARRALDAGELDEATELSAVASEQVDRALWIGLAVVVGALLALAALVVVSWLVVRWVRRRRARRAVLSEPRVVAVVAAPGAEVDAQADPTDDAGDEGSRTDGDRADAESVVS